MVSAPAATGRPETAGYDGNGQPVRVESGARLGRDGGQIEQCQRKVRCGMADGR